MWVFYQKGATWILEDQYGTGRIIPSGAEQQDVFDTVMWQPTPTSRSVLWSRMLKTNDPMHDHNITAGPINVNWAIGPAPTYSAATVHKVCFYVALSVLDRFVIFCFFSLVFWPG